MSGKLLRVHRPSGDSAWIPEDDLIVVITGNGFARILSPFGQAFENILSFPEVVDCIEKENQRWWEEA